MIFFRSVPIILIKFVFLILFLATNVLLARMLSVAEYGSFVFILSLVTVTSIIISLGLEKYVAKTLQICKSGADNRTVSILITDSLMLVFVMMLLVCPVLYYIVLPASLFDIVPAHLYIQIFIIIFMEALLRLYRGITIGVGVPVHSEFCSLFIRPLIFMLLVIINATGETGSITITDTITFYLAASVLAIFPAFYFGDLPAAGKMLSLVLVSPRRLPALAGFALVFLLTEMVFGVYANVDIFMVGLMLDAESSGIYGIANRGGYIIAFIASAFAMVMMTRTSELHANNNISHLQSVFSSTSLLMLTSSIIIFTVYLFFSEAILGFVGVEYLSARIPLLILSLSQVLSAAFGPVGILLIMTGNQWRVIQWLATAILLNIILNLLFIPQFGINAAAVNSLIVMVFWNSVLLYIVSRHLQLKPALISVFQNHAVKTN